MLSPSQIGHLRDILSKSQVLTSPSDLIVYASDASNLSGEPAAVILPHDKDDVVKAMEWSFKGRIPIVPRGAGTGVTGGAVPVAGGIVLVFTAMKGILDIDKENMLAVVEPGVITGELQKTVEREGLYYPPDPASLKACTIGGNIGENAGGPKAVKYGVTRDYCLALEVVLADGTVLNTGARTRKSVVGYDITRLLIGSEGTLGVVTKAFLRLISMPEKVKTMLIGFPTLEDAGKSLIEIFGQGITPSTLELMDQASVRCVCDYLRIAYTGKRNALLLLELDGRPTEVDRDARVIKELLRKQPQVEINEARDEEEREEILLFRRSISPAIYRFGSRKVNEDICVPRSRLVDCFRGLEAIGKRYDLTMANFGHAGDGNIHVNIMIQEEAVAMEKAEVAVREIFAMALSLGGTISGEHGIGLTKAPYLSMELDDKGIKIMKGIKSLLDPYWLLNPGKVFL